MKGTRAVLLLAIALALAVALALLAIHERTPLPSPVEQVPTTWKTARETPMHTLHVGTKKVACSECHASVGSDEAAPSAAVCTKCHEREAKRSHHGGAGAETTCLSCHVFGAGKAAARCIDCHAGDLQRGPRRLEHHARAGVECRACHSLHDDERARLADCTACHDGTRVTHGAFAAQVERGPDSGPHTDVTMDAAALAFLREAGPPGSSFASGHDGGMLPVASFVDPRSTPPGAVCSACHDAHSGKEAARGTCFGCHVEAHRADGRTDRAPALTALAAGAPKIAPRGSHVAGHEGCITCHDPHRARGADARACEGCHADHREVTTVRGHARCSGCHAPHAPAEARGSCRTCHGSVTTLGSERVAAHADCSSCHDAHRPKASPDEACVRCHESVRPSHPAITTAKGARGSCTGCHAPHGGSAASASTVHPATSAPCSSCHTKAADDHAFHAKGTACVQCHAPHAFRLAASDTTLCAKCHAAENAATTQRPGHASCDACHGSPHSPTRRPSCQGCHAPEASTTPKGHSTCTSCHDGHSGALGSRASCTSCHENKTKALHGSTPQGCASCHRPHGPKGAAQPAACSSCHSRSSLVGLHTASAHAPCETCHSAHGPPRADRATCTGSCHTDRKAHQPEAKVCNGCHVFRH